MNTPATEAALSRTFRLSERLSVEITAGSDGFLCEWAPSVPTEFTRTELAAYERARNEMLRLLARMLGGHVIGGGVG
jgi:hypothetical protein